MEKNFRSFFSSFQRLIPQEIMGFIVSDAVRRSLENLRFFPLFVCLLAMVLFLRSNTHFLNLVLRIKEQFKLNPLDS